MEPMIVVTRLNDSQFAINPDLIERIHSNPDTTLVMVDGAKYIVTESMEQVIEAIACYRARVIALAYEPEAAAGRIGMRQLGLVTSADNDPAASPLDDGGNPVPLSPRRK
jgi:flagellar protein FlbD